MDSELANQAVQVGIVIPVKALELEGARGKGAWAAPVAKELVGYPDP